MAGMADNAPESEFMTAKEAQALLGVSKVKMSEYIKSLRVYRLGRDKRVKWLKRSDVERIASEMDTYQPEPEKSTANSAA